MIVRILGEGQYELDAQAVARVEALDATLDAALAADDEALFEKTLGDLLAEIRRSGHRLHASVLVPSDLAVPPEGASVKEVRTLLESETTETG